MRKPVLRAYVRLASPIDLTGGKEMGLDFYRNKSN